MFLRKWVRILFWFTNSQFRKVCVENSVIVCISVYKQKRNAHRGGGRGERQLQGPAYAGACGAIVPGHYNLAILEGISGLELAAFNTFVGGEEPILREKKIIVVLCIV